MDPPISPVPIQYKYPQLFLLIIISSIQTNNMIEILFYYPMLMYSEPQEAALNTLIFSK
jgi:hypothetical protein